MQCLCLQSRFTIASAVLHPLRLTSGHAAEGRAQEEDAGPLSIICCSCPSCSRVLCFIFPAALLRCISKAAAARTRAAPVDRGHRLLLHLRRRRPRRHRLRDTSVQPPFAAEADDATAAATAAVADQPVRQ